MHCGNDSSALPQRRLKLAAVGNLNPYPRRGTASLQYKKNPFLHGNDASLRLDIEMARDIPWHLQFCVVSEVSSSAF